MESKTINIYKLSQVLLLTYPRKDSRRVETGKTPGSNLTRQVQLKSLGSYITTLKSDTESRSVQSGQVCGHRDRLRRHSDRSWRGAGMFWYGRTRALSLLGGTERGVPTGSEKRLARGRQPPATRAYHTTRVSPQQANNTPKLFSDRSLFERDSVFNIREFIDKFVGLLMSVVFCSAQTAGRVDKLCCVLRQVHPFIFSSDVLGCSTPVARRDYEYNQTISGHLISKSGR